MTLPFLTYITVMGYQVDAEANIADVDDSHITQTAVNYGVIPLMLISTIDEYGHGSSAVTHVLLNNKELQNTLINNIITVIQEKGFYGAVFGFQYILEDDLVKYIEFLENASQMLHNSGYLSQVVLIPTTFGYTDNPKFEQTYFFRIGQAADEVILLSYQWARDYIPNIYQTSFSYLKNYLYEVLTHIPPEKIFLGVSRIAYDWELPYYEGLSHVSALTNPSALALANQYDSEILFDENTQFPYFYYDLAGTEHLVWFKDARHTNAILELVSDYGLGGVAIWNIMNFFRIWLVINTQFEIVKLLPVE
jgi:spore germination protein